MTYPSSRTARPLRALAELRKWYDRWWLLSFALWLTAYCSGVLLIHAEDHHGAWEWAAWVLVAASVSQISVAADRMRKGK